MFNFLFNQLEGMPDQSKLDAIFNLEKGKSKTFEWTVNILNTQSADGLGVRFGRMSFEKSPDGSYVNCKLFVYKLDFTLVPNTKWTNDSILNGLYNLSNSEEVGVERGYTKSENRFHDYIKHKAILEFQKEGFLDRNQQEVNYLN